MQKIYITRLKIRPRIVHKSIMLLQLELGSDTQWWLPPIYMIMRTLSGLHDYQPVFTCRPKS